MFFSLTILEDIGPFRGATVTLFWTSGDVCPGFKSQGGSLTCCLNSVILRFTSGATPADCMRVNMAAEPFRSTYLQICSQALVEARGSNATSTAL